MPTDDAILIPVCLVVMTGHAFQVLLGDEQLRESLASIRRAYGRA